MNEDEKAAADWTISHSGFFATNAVNRHEGFLAGIANERAKWLEHFKAYREAYAEDLFTPIATGEKNDGTDRFTTRVSGHMGRFILDNLIRHAEVGKTE